MLNVVSLGFPMEQIFASDRGPITERGGCSKTMTSNMRHTEAVCLHPTLAAEAYRLLPRRTSVALHTSSGIIETIGYELGTGAFDRHS